MNLVVDVGNTRIKYAFFEGGQFLEAKYQADDLTEDLKKWKSRGVPLHLFLSGSGQITQELRMLLQKSADSYTEASAHLKLPLRIGYSTPATLGFDRIGNEIQGIAGIYGKVASGGSPDGIWGDGDKYGGSYPEWSNGWYAF